MLLCDILLRSYLASIPSCFTLLPFSIPKDQGSNLAGAWIVDMATSKAEQQALIQKGVDAMLQRVLADLNVSCILAVCMHSGLSCSVQRQQSKGYHVS